MKWTLAAYYKFFDLENLGNIQSQLLSKATEIGLCGSTLIAPEGINGTMAGLGDTIREWLTFLEQDMGFGPIEAKFSIQNGDPPFRRCKIRLKTEIVHLGRPEIRPDTCAVGTYVEAKDWNALISDPDVRVIDTRNDFECEVGTFEGAENPHTDSFGDFPEFVRTRMHPEKDKKVAMFCTGGIRCEKATAYLLEQGFQEVYHLKGGILKYFEEVPEPESLWRGECFVFDDRITVNHKLEPGDTDCCRGCWNPLLPGDREHAHFEEGVCCPRCFETKTEKQLAGARERERQRILAGQRAAQTGVSSSRHDKTARLIPDAAADPGK